MLKKGLKWLGSIIGGLVILVTVALVIGYFRFQTALGQTFDVPLEAINVPAEPELVARGEVLVNITGCVQCHGHRLDGRDVPYEELAEDNCAFSTPRYCPPNLTTGAGGIAARYSDAEIERAVRHGVRQDGTSLLSPMPTEIYNETLSDDEMAAIIAYLRYGAEPIDREIEDPGSPILVGVLGTGLVSPLDEEFAAGYIDHTRSHRATRPVEIGPTAEYGEYLHEIACTLCHHEGAEPLPDGRIVPNNLLIVGAYSEEEFFRLLREAKARDGRQLHRFMEAFGILPDEEITALYLYLQSIASGE